VERAKTLTATPTSERETLPARAPDSPDDKPDYSDAYQVSPGQYLFEEPIAEGGMGRIFRARDRRLGRQVAIKEMRAHSPDLVERFRRETRITAKLQHPSIVAIHEGGVWPNGDPFFAMEMIAGRALNKVIAETKASHERIALLPHVIAVADALAYAHSVGVIHRDLKPGNVLVGDFGETVVIDWGLARELGEADGSLPDSKPEAIETRVGAVLGTPAYMPPEQARGERVDERADVYAIGALLFHVLAGTPPVTGSSSDEILAKVIDDGARPLTELAPDIPPDLVAIVEKAMKRERDERYRTARELAEDLRRYQTGRLVGAHHYTFAQRVRRFVARHRLVLSVATIALVLLVTGAIYSLRRIVDERDRAVAATREATAQRSTAEARRQAAEDLVAFMVGELKPALERVGRLDVMRAVGTKIESFYLRMSEVGDFDLPAIERRATAIRTLGDVLDAAGDVEGSRRTYEHALAILTPHTTTGLALARTQIALAIALDQQGDLDGTVKSLDAARSALATVTPTSDVHTERARADRWLGIVEQQRGNARSAEASFTNAIAHATLAGADRDGRAELAKGHDRRFDARRALGDREGALADANASLAIRQELVREDPQDLPARYALVISWDKIYAEARSANRLADAQHAAEQQIQITEMLVRHDPSNTDWRRSLLIASTRFADLAHERGDLGVALRMQERVVRAAREIVDLDPSNSAALADYATLAIGLGNQLSVAGDMKAALAILEDALATHRALESRFPGRAETQVATTLQAIGDAYTLRADATHAAEAFARAVAIYETRAKREPTNAVRRAELATSQLELGRALANLPARRDEGIAMMAGALETLRAMVKDGSGTDELASLMPSYEAYAKSYTYKKPRTDESPPTR
jgi:tetratricopeptide (TPR) repeat protein/predicted Ser/Thr protein kinase